MNELIKKILEALFNELEKKFANRPIILMVLSILETLIPDLLPLILARPDVRSALGVAGAVSATSASFVTPTPPPV